MKANTKNGIDTEKAQALGLIREVFKNQAAWLLEHGFTWPEIRDEMQAAVVEASENALERTGRNPSQREIYRLTGIHPVAIRTCRKHSEPEDRNISKLSLLFHTWKNKRPYGRKNKPNELHINTDVGACFKKLCQEVMPGYSYQGVLIELMEYRVVAIKNDKVRIIKDTVVPNKLSTEMLTQQCMSAKYFFSTLFHNAAFDNQPEGVFYSRHFERYTGNGVDVDDERALWSELRDALTENLKNADHIIAQREITHDKTKTSQPPKRQFIVSMFLGIDPPIPGGYSNEEN